MSLQLINIMRIYYPHYKISYVTQIFYVASWLLVETNHVVKMNKLISRKNWCWQNSTDVKYTHPFYDIKARI